jgi:hypothetical protein
MTEYQKDLLELAYFKRRFREEGNKTMWRECIKVEKVAKNSPADDAQMIVRHALDVIHEHFRRY